MLPEEYKRRTACPFNLPEFNAVRTILVIFSRESGRYLAVLLIKSRLTIYNTIS
nr:MAG TPA: hypothetical protein [Caudoviricetes sp.]